MIQYIWIFLLFGSSYVSKMNSEFLFSTVMQYNNTTPEVLVNNSTGSFNFSNRNARDARLLEGETMGGLKNCDSFQIGDKNKKEFYSPNYPKEYPNQATCTRIIKADSKDEQVILDFRDQFDMEPSENCKFDKLEIRDGSYGYSPIVDKYCGHQFPPMIKSSGSSLWLRFQSDENIEYKGFRAVYWFEKRKDFGSELNEQPCVINKTENQGDFNLSDQDIPQEYKERASRTGIDCMFRIIVEDKKQVSLSWDEFSLQYPNDCDLNYVHILEENSDTIKQTFCGAAAEPIVFGSNLMQIQYVVKKAAINSSFNAHYTPFRKSTNCTNDEFNCQDGNCIDKSLQCNDVNNCLTASDEDAEECNKRKAESFWKQITKIDLLIILIVFFLILFGMCFTLIFNIVRKLIHDFSVIKEHVNQSRESQLNQLGRKTPTATLLTPMVTVLPNLTDSLVNVTEIVTPMDIRRDSSFNKKEDDNDCYVPTEHTFPNLIRRESGFERINDGPRYHHSSTCQTYRESATREFNGGGGGDDDDDEEDGLVMRSGGDSTSYAPETRDNECQTRESLFFNPSTYESTGRRITGGLSSSPSPSPTPPAPCGATIRKPVNTPTLPPTTAPSIGFTTFGYKNNQKPDKMNKISKEHQHRFRAEAVIEMERFKSPRLDITSSTESRSIRPYSIQSTKSAPDVIVTH